MSDTDFDGAMETLRFQIRQARGPILIPSEMERQLDFIVMAHADVVAKLADSRWSNWWMSVEYVCICGHTEDDDDDWVKLCEDGGNCPSCGRQLAEGDDGPVGRLTNNERIARLEQQNDKQKRALDWLRGRGAYNTDGNWPLALGALVDEALDNADKDAARDRATNTEHWRER